MSNNSLFLQMYCNGQRYATYVGFWRPIIVVNVKLSIIAPAYIKYMIGKMDTKTYVAPRQKTATISCFLNMKS